VREWQRYVRFGPEGGGDQAIRRGGRNFRPHMRFFSFWRARAHFQFFDLECIKLIFLACKLFKI
jgi:hypothetical protein